MTRRHLGTFAALLLAPAAWAAPANPPAALPPAPAPQAAASQPTPAGPVNVPTFSPDQPTCASGCTAPGSPARCWVSGEYLFWWVRDGNLPFPVVTTSPAASLGI